VAHPSLPLFGWGFERLKIGKPEAKCTSVYNRIEIRACRVFSHPSAQNALGWGTRPRSCEHL
jgi:hypothetical protein